MTLQRRQRGSGGSLRAVRMLARLFGWLALGVLGTSALAQQLALSSPAAAIGRAALGEVPKGQVAVGIWRDGQTRYAFVQAGPATLTAGSAQNPATLEIAAPDPAAETLFEMGSISKVFTGLLLAQAVERGELRLDDRLGDLLAPGVTLSSPAVAAITLRQLVTHSSCLPRLPADFREGAKPASPYESYDRERLWRALAAQSLKAPPPCDPAYSNFAFAALGEVLAGRAGKPWFELVRERITGPLGMRHTLVALGDQASRLAPPFDGRLAAFAWEMQAFAGAGGLRSTVGDLLIFSRAVLAGAEGPLGPAVARFLTPLGSMNTGDIGYGVWIRGPHERRTFFHEGLTGGYRALWMVMPATQEAVVVLTSNAQATPWRVRNALTASYYPLTVQSAPATAPLVDYAGVYQSPRFGTITFAAQDGVLYRRPVNGSFQPLSPAGADTFVDVDAGVMHRFSRKDGRVAILQFTQGGGAVTLARTDVAPPSQALLPPAQLQAYVGAYLYRRLVGPNLNFDVRARDGQLQVRVNNQSFYNVYPVADQTDRFSYEVVKAELQFERDSAGQVSGLVLHQNGEHRALRTGG